MGEIKTNDLQEMKNPVIENFRNIIPEAGTKIKEVQNFWIKEMNSKSGYGGEFNKYEDRIKHTPNEANENCYYKNERGESTLYPSEKTEKGRMMIDLLKEYGLEKKKKKNGEPIFSKCAEATVQIENMTENRYDYKDSNGVQQKGNFSQADIECAKQWNNEKREGRTDWKDEDVYNYRKANNLTWHERCDTKTMDLVRTEIHDFFKHTGGVYECKARDNNGVSGGKFDE